MANGARANKTGNMLELNVEDTLKRHGYIEFQGNKKDAFTNRKSINGKQYIKQLLVGETIYKSKRKVDFMVFNQNNFPDGLIIECKWQQSGGSVDEKYPFLYFNILKTDVPTIVLLDGGGYKPAAKDWLADRVEENPKLLLGVWNMTEFQKQTNNGFLS